MREVFKQLCPVRCMDDFGVELDAIEFTVFIGDDRIGSAIGFADRTECAWQMGDFVAVAHPYHFAATLGPEPFHDAAVIDEVDIGAAESTALTVLHDTAELMDHQLLAIADAE